MAVVFCPILWGLIVKSLFAWRNCVFLSATSIPLSWARMGISWDLKTRASNYPVSLIWLSYFKHLCPFSWRGCCRRHRISKRRAPTLQSGSFRSLWRTVRCVSHLAKDFCEKISCRPEAVNISNMAALVDSEGKPHFKYIVEGANLFIAQQARLYLEKRKVVLFKDSSANKGTHPRSVFNRSWGFYWRP